MPATGRPFQMETMYIIRLDDEGKIAEHWGIGDMVGVMQQLALCHLLPARPPRTITYAVDILAR
jgi:hypothetical protein